MSHEGHETSGVGEEGASTRNRLRHWLMMFVCCLPMIGVAVGLVAIGVVDASFLIVALLCVAMMPIMHGLMGGGHHRGG